MHQRTKKHAAIYKSIIISVNIIHKMIPIQDDNKVFKQCILKGHIIVHVMTRVTMVSKPGPWLFVGLRPSRNRKPVYLYHRPHFSISSWFFEGKLWLTMLSSELFFLGTDMFQLHSLPVVNSIMWCIEYWIYLKFFPN